MTAQEKLFNAMIANRRHHGRGAGCRAGWDVDQTGNTRLFSAATPDGAFAHGRVYERMRERDLDQRRRKPERLS